MHLPPAIEFRTVYEEKPRETFEVTFVPAIAQE